MSTLSLTIQIYVGGLVYIYYLFVVHVLLWRQYGNKSTKPLELKMHQISLGLNQSCSKCPRVQIIPEFYITLFCHQQ